MGKLAEEVDNFKYSCQARANQAAELSENVGQDCIQPLRDLLKKQDKEFNSIDESARKKIGKLVAFDREIKQSASAYFKSARETEDYSAKY